MDGMNFSDLGAVLNLLKENPQMLQMLSSMLGKSASPPPPEVQSRPQGTPIDTNTLASIINMLGKNGSAPPQNQQTSAPKTREMTVFGSSEEIKNRITLLNAIRPYLNENRRARLETVIKLLRLAELGSLSQILG